MKKNNPARASSKPRSAGTARPAVAHARPGATQPHKSIPKAKAAAAFQSRPAELVQLVVVFLCAAILGFFLYAPAANGPFLFDDRYLPFLDLHLIGQPITAWLVGLRPVVNLSFWLNAQISGEDTWSYHALNVLLHVVNSVSVFLIARWFLRRMNITPSRVDLLSLFGGALFLVHPLQTESVAYLSSRSETLAVFFFYAAFLVFLYGRDKGVSWPSTIVILALFAAAQLSKEYAAVFPFLLLLTDWLFPSDKARGFIGAIRSNWRLYTLMLAGVAVAAGVIARILSSAKTAGFNIREGGPLDYFVTQGKAIWAYLRLFVLPFGQNVDPDFPFSHGFRDPLAIAGLFLLAALAGGAIYFRRKYPLASFGFLATLLCLAPTSSFLPISDPFAEHRLYLPMFALILVVLDLLSRWQTDGRALMGATAAIILLFGYLTFERNRIWGNELALWQDASTKSPRKVRPHFQLAFAEYRAGNCPAAVTAFQQTSQLAPPTYDLLHDWAEAEDCAGNEQHALQLFQQAGAAHPSGLISSQIGMVYAKQGHYAEALAVLDRAAKEDPGLATIYAYRGNIYFLQHDYARAAEQFQQALDRDPTNNMATQGLPLAKQRLGAAH